MSETLEHVLDDEQRIANVLRANKHADDADIIERVIGRVRTAAEDFITWLPEPDAVLRSGHSKDWLRAQFAQWMEQGHARLNGSVREYRQLIVPQRGHASAAREAGRIAGQVRRRKIG